jgi:hypothetical protein
MLLVLFVVGMALIAGAADNAVLPSITRVPMPDPVVKKSVTLIYSFEGQTPSPGVVSALKSELDDNWRSSRIEFQWRAYDAMIFGETYADLVVVHFRGNCQDSPAGAASSKRPPDISPFRDAALASSPVVDRVIQPFSIVYCDRVQSLVLPEVERRGKNVEAGPLLGRALGRVLSHELYHILHQTRQHEKSGLAKSRLTGAQLIADGFDFEHVP